jgi:hypothetical protein
VPKKDLTGPTLLEMPDCVALSDKCFWTDPNETEGTLKQVSGELNSWSVTKLSLKVAQNEQKLSNSRKLKTSLSYSWQRDLIVFSIR